MDASTEWTLAKIEIELIRWGEDKGKYRGKVQFTNLKGDEFTCRIDPDRTYEFIGPVSDVIQQNAHELARTIGASLKRKDD